MKLLSALAGYLVIPTAAQAQAADKPQPSQYRTGASRGVVRQGEPGCPSGSADHVSDQGSESLR